MRWASVCSGIGAPECAWADVFGPPVYVSEVAKFPSAVLKHHYPEVPNRGDFTTIEGGANLGLLVGGTPCQDFSVAGLRAGLAGARGQLTLEFLRLVGRERPRWVVWENVPGVLSADGGRAFGTFLGLLGQLGYGWAYRVFDAQYAGVPQRRRRVFLVGHLGDWRPPAAVLFERHSLSGHPPPRREAGQGVAASLKGRAGNNGSPERGDLNVVQIAIAFQHNQDWSVHEDQSPAVTSSHGGAPAVAFTERGREGGRALEVQEELMYALKTGAGGGQTDNRMVAAGMAARRLTPVECERLMGFPDGWTAVAYRSKPAADGPRYEALGNSMSVNDVRWIGERIALVERVLAERKEAA